jgi:hypothetical protein
VPELAIAPLGPLSILVSSDAGLEPVASPPCGCVAAYAIAAWQATNKATRREIASRGLRRLIRARLNKAVSPYGLRRTAHHSARWLGGNSHGSPDFVAARFIG